MSRIRAKVIYQTSNCKLKMNSLERTHWITHSIKKSHWYTCKLWLHKTRNITVSNKVTQSGRYFALIDGRIIKYLRGPYKFRVEKKVQRRMSLFLLNSDQRPKRGGFFTPRPAPSKNFFTRPRPGPALYFFASPSPPRLDFPRLFVDSFLVFY